MLSSIDFICGRYKYFAWYTSYLGASSIL